MTILFIIPAFLFMEFVAWFSHKYIMHGFLWVLHRDHHIPHPGRFQKNDFFALIFAVPSILLIIFGSASDFDYKFWLGMGIALYGISYFLYHDVLVHQRIKLFREINSRYLNAIIKAHLDHHKGKKNYGFLFMVPGRYIREAYTNVK